MSTPDDPDSRAWFREPGYLLPYLLFGPVIGLIAMTGYAWAEGGAISLAVGSLAALAALLAGSLIGFVFAIPKQGGGSAPAGSPQARAGFISNDNLVEVSDWLTKILVGLGLIQFGRAVDGGTEIVDALATALGGNASSAAFATAVLIIYSISGFLGAYILTRAYVGPVFARSDDAMKTFVEERVDAIVGARMDELQATIEDTSSARRV